MLSKTMTEMLNHQINREMYSAYLYQAMSGYASSKGWKGVANWFQIQVQEELFHAKKLYDYVFEQDERVIMQAIEQPESDFESVLQLFETTLEHEKLVTDGIHKLMTQAKQENDHATEIMLQWFVSEQVEEESTAKDLIDQVKMIGEVGGGFFMLDKELAARVFTPPTAN